MQKFWTAACQIYQLFHRFPGTMTLNKSSSAIKIKKSTKPKKVSDSSGKSLKGDVKPIIKQKTKATKSNNDGSSKDETQTGSNKVKKTKVTMPSETPKNSETSKTLKPKRSQKPGNKSKGKLKKGENKGATAFPKGIMKKKKVSTKTASTKKKVTDQDEISDAEEDVSLS